MEKRALTLTVKGLIVGVLILLMLIPVLFISNTISERSYRQREVAEEVSGKWAGSQTICGPVLVIPYMETYSENIIDRSTNKSTTVNRQSKSLFYLLPENLGINGALEPQIRKRSIFKIAVYSADVEISGSFVAANLEELGIKPEDVLWDQAHVCFGLSDFRGIEEQMVATWDGKQYDLNAGVPSNSVVSNGLSFRPEGLANAGHNFSLKLKLRGSETFYMTPIGKTTTVALSSSWQNPSFVGNFLPNNPAQISDDGFHAEWKVLHLNRNYPQAWKDGGYVEEVEIDDMDVVSDSKFGVELLQSADTYDKTQRSVKYAILFIGLTFALYFFMEIIHGRQVHALQYVLVGLALSIFYILLLSISEYIGFNWAYLIASAATISLITWYSYSMFRARGVVMTLSGVLVLLYGFIFILLQLQDGALLFGSIGLFAILAWIMYYSRKVDWQQKG